MRLLFVGQVPFEGETEAALLEVVLPAEEGPHYPLHVALLLRCGPVPIKIL
jgi:hypothetical protein